MHPKKRKPWRNRMKLTTLLKFFLGASVSGTCAIAFFWHSIFFNSGGDISCFDQPGNLLDELSLDEPVSGESIFFHETSCGKTCSDIRLGPRQACSVETALRAHPEKDVFLLVSSPVLVPVFHTRNPLIHQLGKYSNFKVRHISFSRYLSGTPLSVIVESGALNSSLWPVSHASDVLRYATLYKFGGIYLDLDVIVLKPLSRLVNFAGAESNISIGSGLLGFGRDAVGRQVALNCAHELARTFNGEIWGFNGPGVITRVLNRRCGTETIANMSKLRCHGFDVHGTESFAPISFRDIQLFFSRDRKNLVSKLLARSYAIHFWNKFSSGFALSNHSDVPFVAYARTYCPKVFEAVAGSF